MKILIDENMPYAEALFSQLGEVTMKSGRTLTADDLVDVDALMICSVTKVNEALISKANKLKFVGTATAGMDHVDQELMKERGIFFTAAPGCNKVGVAARLVRWCWLSNKAFLFLINSRYCWCWSSGQQLLKVP